MPRELHPELFGEQIINQAKEKLTVDPVDSIRRKVTQIEARFIELTSIVERLSLNIEKRFKDLEIKEATSTKETADTFNDLKQNMDTLQKRVHEQELSDHKVQDLIDRHNVLVQQFELRMQGMQKVANEQEYKLLTYNKTLQEILREIRNIRNT
jgi:nitrogenase subunit NifH